MWMRESDGSSETFIMSGKLLMRYSVIKLFLVHTLLGAYTASHCILQLCSSSSFLGRVAERRSEISGIPAVASRPEAERASERQHGRCRLVLP